MVEQQRRRTALPKLTDRLSLGEAKLQVSPFCLGMVASEDAACAAFDLGINFFFITSDMHWPLYEKARRSLTKLLERGGGIRDKIVVGIVNYNTQPEFCSAPFQEVLEVMPKLERIDVAIAGGAYSHEIMTRLRVYESHRARNYLGIRSIGTTFHDRAAASQGINYNLVDIAFLRYNAAHPGALADTLPLLHGKSSTLVYNFKSTFGYIPHEVYPKLGLTEEHWHPKITDHYRFVLTRSQIHGVLCSPSTPDEISALSKALEEGPLDQEEENYLMNLSDLGQGKAVLASQADGSPKPEPQ